MAESDDDGLRKADRRNQRAERPVARLTQFETNIGEFREWAKRIVGDDNQRNVAFRDIGGDLHHIGRIILEADTIIIASFFVTTRVRWRTSPPIESRKWLRKSSRVRP